jgi:two-component system, NtrC family, sensor kinase
VQNLALRSGVLAAVQALSMSTRVWYLRCPGLVLIVVGRLHERVVTRQSDCVGGMPARSTGAVAGGVAMKARNQRTTKVKRRKEAMATRRRPPNDNLKRTLADCRRELKEALERHAATNEVLRVIARSPSDTQPVFDTIVTSAARLCKARFCWVFRFDGKLIHFAAEHGLSPDYAEEIRSRYPIPPGRTSAAARAVLTGAVAEIPDAQVDTEYEHADGAKAKGFRSLLAVPMLKDGHALGAIVIARTQTGRFPGQQIELLRTFAQQAVIAIQNVRLFDAEMARTRELTESLQRQTATADVLKVISRSTFDLQSVLNTLVESAVRLCEADMGSINRQHGEFFRQVANYGHSTELQAFMDTHPIPSGRGSIVGRTVLEGGTVHVDDVMAEPDYRMSDAARIGGIRTMLGVPLLREGMPIGVIVLQRKTVRPFTDKQIELVTTFADQAVIAIENVRLFEAEQQRTRELTESLEQQTATSEVLQVISSSPGELEPVFEAMLANATRLCEAKFGNLFLYKEGGLRIVASHNVPPAFAQARRRGPLYPPPGTGLCEAIRTKQTVHVTDLAAAQPYVERNPAVVEAVELGGVRTFVAVPMLKDNELIGMIVIYRQEVRPFADKQVALVANFANQAVIAIENTRLLNELRQRTTDLSESLEQQAATSEVLQVISSSPGDLKPVFEKLLANATRLCGAQFGNLDLREGDGFRIAALHNAPTAYIEWRQHQPVVHITGLPHIPLARIVRTKAVQHVPDLTKDEAYIKRAPPIIALVESAGARSLLSVPMLKDGEVIGAIVIYRQEVRPFTEKQIELITSFARQAVIAIENARLLKELRQRTHDLSEALEQQTATSEVLKVISRSAFESQSRTCVCSTRSRTRAGSLKWRVSTSRSSSPI